MAESMVELGERSAETLKKEIRRKIKEAGVEIDYVETVNAATLAPLSVMSGNCLIAAAIFVGKTRLIDNTIISI
jgi:pantoate--beta-alanine ligase